MDKVKQFSYQSWALCLLLIGPCKSRRYTKFYGTDLNAAATLAHDSMIGNVLNIMNSCKIGLFHYYIYLIHFTGHPNV